MNHKFLLGSAIAAALLFGANAASACAITAWSSATGLTVADTGEPGAFKRYSGRCGLRIADAATPRFVQDNTPADEKSYRVRVYYFTGNITGATADIFQARSNGGTNIIRVTHDGNQLSFTTNTGGAAQSVIVADNAYYSIELAWAAGTVAPATTGSLTGTVTGNSGNAATATVAGTVNFTGLANTADSITDARIGIIAGVPTVTSAVFFDEFDSRRTTNPGRLLRGDANGNSSTTPADATAILNEFNNGVLGAGQPDCGENGAVTPADATCVLNIFNNG